METIIILPVSRAAYLQKLFANLEVLECDRNKTGLLVYVDGDMDLFQKAHNFTVHSKFMQRLCVFRGRGVTDDGHMLKRRQRIADIHNELKEHIYDSKYVFLLEDDVVLPPSALQKLIKIHGMYPHAGFVSGLQLGRHGFLHIGAWHFDDVYEPQRIVSMLAPQESIKNKIEHVDAAGLYCCLTKTENYMAHEFKPFEKVLGPDVDFGIELRKRGHQNFVDISIKCGHRTPKEVIEFYNSDILQVQLDKTDDPTVKSGWKLKTIVQLQMEMD